MAAFVSLTSASQAQPLVYEGFNYTAGGLAGQSGGGSLGFTNNWGTGGNSVTSPGLSFGSLLVTGNKGTTVGNNDGNFRNTGLFNTGTVFVSLLANSGGALPEYAGISLFQGGSENLFIGKPFQQPNWGIDQSTGLQSSTVPVNSTVHLFVAQIDFNANGPNLDRVRLFIDPTPGLASPNVAAAIDVGTTRTTAFDNIRIQAGTGAGVINFDEFRVGTTYLSVTPVPEPTSLALAGLAASGLLLRRKRKN